ncbi:uncharacterized protein LOC122245446 [Penaeus japonicus]|uniref:uncharacterized protein LOC122245446 n=1 Tax=Penaeus japonicus TaxID=27405 RepID=UPI001C715757|nr:uncharacterized protein LOC122245446 [Penaeus japonicus]
MKLQCVLLFLFCSGSWQISGASDYKAINAMADTEAEFQDDDIDSRDDDDYDLDNFEDDEPDYFDDDDASEEIYGRFRREVRRDFGQFSRRHERMRRQACKQRNGYCIPTNGNCPGKRIEKFCSRYNGHCCFPEYPLPDQTCEGREINMTDGETITDTQGFIKSEGFPYIYNRHTYQIMDIVVPEDQVIEFEWKALDLSTIATANLIM